MIFRLLEVIAVIIGLIPLEIVFKKHEERKNTKSSSNKWVEEYSEEKNLDKNKLSGFIKKILNFVVRCVIGTILLTMIWINLSINIIIKPEIPKTQTTAYWGMVLKMTLETIIITVLVIYNLLMSNYFIEIFYYIKKRSLKLKIKEEMIKYWPVFTILFIYTLFVGVAPFCMIYYIPKDIQRNTIEIMSMLITGLFAPFYIIIMTCFFYVSCLPIYDEYISILRITKDTFDKLEINNEPISLITNFENNKKDNIIKSFASIFPEDKNPQQIEIVKSTQDKDSDAIHKLYDLLLYHRQLHNFFTVPSALSILFYIIEQILEIFFWTYSDEDYIVMVFFQIFVILIRIISLWMLMYTPDKVLSQVGFKLKLYSKGANFAQLLILINQSIISSAA